MMKRIAIAITAVLAITACSDLNPIAPEREGAEPEVEAVAPSTAWYGEVSAAVDDAMNRIVPSVGDAATSDQLRNALAALGSAIELQEAADIPGLLERTRGVLGRGVASESISSGDAGVIDLLLDRVGFLLSKNP
jgi:hypothetical protein